MLLLLARVQGEAAHPPAAWHGVSCGDLACKDSRLELAVLLKQRNRIRRMQGCGETLDK